MIDVTTNNEGGINMSKIYIFVAVLFFFTMNNSVFSMNKEKKSYKRTKSFPVIINSNVKKINFQKKKYSQSVKTLLSKGSGERVNYTHRIKYSGANICSSNKGLKECPFVEPIKKDEDPENEITRMDRIIVLKKRCNERKKKQSVWASL